MEPTKLAEYGNREQAHAELARVLAEGTHTQAECREAPNAAMQFQVWSGPAVKPIVVVAPPVDKVAVLEAKLDALIAALTAPK